MADNVHRLIDMQAPEHERRWVVSLDAMPGLRVQALDDLDRPFDEVRLERLGAFIVVQRPDVQLPVLPAALSFLAPTLELRAKAQSLGIKLKLPVVLIHTGRVAALFTLGYLPAALRPEVGKKGSARLFGIDVVWSEELDRYADG